MLFSEAQRYPRSAAYAPQSTTAVAALAYLRQQTFPQFVAPPRFIPRARPLPARPEWLTRLLQRLTRQVVIAASFAAVVVVLATALPAWAALQQNSSSAPASAPAGVTRSSTGVTGTAATRVENLGVATFVETVPFIQRSRYLDALAGAAPEASRFVDGARQASMAAYLQGISMEMGYPYLTDAVNTKQAIAFRNAVAAEMQRQQAMRAAASRSVWQAAPLASGTHIPGATVTFYACVGNGFCGNMATGQPAFEGAAACSTDLPFGTRFVIANDPSQRVFVCLDRGALRPTWVDVWFYNAADGWSWQSLVGTRSDIIIVD